MVPVLFLLSSFSENSDTKRQPDRHVQNYQMQCGHLLSCYFILTHVQKDATLYFFFINLCLNVKMCGGDLLQLHLKVHGACS